MVDAAKDLGVFLALQKQTLIITLNYSEASNNYHTISSFPFSPSKLGFGFIMGNMSSLTILFIFLLVGDLMICCSGKEVNATFGCIPRERRALVKFMTSFSNPFPLLSSWNGSKDCCTWYGVKCDKITGHVISLDLGYRNRNMLVSRNLDCSLLELKHLRYLDLSGNDFQGSSIPSFLGSMEQLRHLNLSRAIFGGVIPHYIGNISSLRVLDLNYVLGLMVDDFTWVSRLSLLKHLDMSGVDMRQTKDLLKVLNMLPSIVVLSLQSSNLDNTNLQHACVNSTLDNVQYLNLRGNRFDGELPCFLDNMTSLIGLDLSHNSYNSTALRLTRLKNLIQLGLGSNLFHQKADWISETLSDKCRLESLDLSDNSFYGEMSKLLPNFSECTGNNFYGHFHKELDEFNKLSYLYHSNNSISNLNLASRHNSLALRVVYLSLNQLSGSIPLWLGCFRNLRALSIYHNQFSGFTPLGTLRNLRVLQLSHNQLSGSIPSWLETLKTLRELDLSKNQLSGSIPSWVGTLKTLAILYLSFNQFSGPIPQSLENLSALTRLSLQNNQLNGEVPLFLGQLSSLEALSITNNTFNGTIVEAHFATLSKLQYLWMSSNLYKFRVGYDWVPPFQLEILYMDYCDIGGLFPQWLQTQKKLELLSLSNCNISGTIPNWLYDMKVSSLYLRFNFIEGYVSTLPSSMEYLDMSYNYIKHDLPSNIGDMMPLLVYLNLAQNNINGSIPQSLCEMKELKALDLSENNLSGNLPNCWENSYLKFISLHSNELSGVIPNSIGVGGALSLRWLQLKNNNFTGKLPSSLKSCTQLRGLDIGDNMISGELPKWIGKYMLELQVLVIRSNQFYGMIPLEFCQIQLQIIDLANNKLKGRIPPCFGSLSRMIKDENTRYLDPSSWYVQSLTQVLKGSELNYTSIRTTLVNMDLSVNKLVGEIPPELTNLSGLIGLNLSFNHLEGKIPNRIGNMESLESLDLSNNNLSGHIPQSLSNLSFLSHLNLSHNDLSGPIPTGHQLQTLEDPYKNPYEGNPKLCGAPLLKKCGASNVEDHVPENERNTTDEEILYGVIVSGFATGFWGAIGVLVLKRSWRYALFNFIEVRICRMFGI